MITKKFSISSQFDFSKLLDDLRILGGSAGTTIEEGNHYKLVVAEKFFYRSCSAASVSLLFMEKTDTYEVTCVVSGAGTGVLNMDYGASDKYMKQVYEILVKQGALIK